MRYRIGSIGLALWLIACSGGSSGDGNGNGNTINPDALCSLSGESYDSFYGADGPYCEAADGGEGSDCLAGDTCREDGSCEFVLSVSQEGICDLIGIRYDSFYDAGGPYCEAADGGEGSNCFPGDRCRDDGYCEAVMSSIGAPPLAELFGRVYDSFYAAGGPYCRAADGGEGSNCFAGDRCRDDGYCEIVLSARGGEIDVSRLGQVYDAFYEANGPYCEAADGGEGSNCYPGDLCRDDGKCEVVYSARI